MANPFMIDPTAGRGQGLQGLANVVRQNREQRQAQERQQTMQTEVSEAVASGDPSRMAEISIKYPQMADAAKTAFGFTNPSSEAQARETYRRALSDPENAAQYVEEGIAQVQAAGGQPAMMARDLAMLQQNPEAALQSMRMGYASIDPKGFLALQAVSGERFKEKEFDLKQQTLDIRKEENLARKDEAALAREDNALKREELQLKIDERKQKIQTAKADVESQASNAITALDSSVATIDRLLAHPGLTSAVGTSSALPTIPGTEKANFEAELEAFDAQNFLTSVKQMKGMGALSESEGKKISAAIGAVNPAMTEPAFRNSLKIIRDGFEKAKNKASAGQGAPAPQYTEGMTATNPQTGQTLTFINGAWQ